jgi:prephenate dehydratase
VKVGVSGNAGSFSEEAGQIYIKKAGLGLAEIIHLLDMDGVLKALSKQEVDIGIFPIVNNNSGLVWPAIQAMGQYSFKPIDELAINVEQCLMAQLPLSLDTISAVYSYTPALQQCKNFLANSLTNVPLIDWGDTARAACDLAEGKLPLDSAVIASANAAKKYGLTILVHSIQDVRPNVTHFVVVKSLS